MKDFAPNNEARKREWLMSRVTYFIDDEEKEEKEIIINYDECKFKVNGKCYNNFRRFQKIRKEMLFRGELHSFFTRTGGRK